ncbi:LRR receptor-like serine threonine-protein kinase [Seminavis robusta]|uniref:LRR receptor-like serine threonine-protein kinase n=1 Tax=Seminavis robusta TaxID=568900 RepID=A0A9N8ELL5_9STRA|nr:LRR receptor-like serine threonine-protein kinase [Seminavis robusta]|eukprot:Sro1133_g244850.1 LRR receptor-like serine threonine-protein kinase (605) ;mRNA; f:25148-27353
MPGAYAVAGIGIWDNNHHHHEEGWEDLEGRESLPDSPTVTQPMGEEENTDSLLVLFTSSPIPPLDTKPMPKQYWRQRLFRVLSLEVNVVLLAVVVVLLAFMAVSITNNGSTNTNSQSTAIQISGSLELSSLELSKPTMAPTSFLDSLNLPQYTLEALENPRTPQSKAYQWLTNNLNNSNQNSTLQDLPKWRQLQRFALATFYYSTRGDYWVKKHGWMDWETDECNWEQRLSFRLDDSPEELNCNAIGEIKALSFRNANNMEGTLPPEISILGNSLQLLAMNWQLELTGNIPSEVGLLTKLTELGLTTTKLSGSLPTELGLLQTLNGFMISGMFSGTIPAELGNLGNLTDFSLQQTNLTGTFPNNFFKICGLETFFVDDCPGLDTESVPELVARGMPKLRLFALSNRVLGEEIHIPTELGILSELEFLQLSDWYLNGTIPDELGKLTKLSLLDLSKNGISGNFPSFLSKFDNLGYLNIHANHFEGKLPPHLIAQLPKLQKLYISENQFFGSIPTEVGLVSSLKKLEMQNTNLSGTLPSELLALENLTSLVVANTSLSGSIPEQLCGKMYQQELKCFGEHCYNQVQHENLICQGTCLCGCDCDLCQ